MGNVPTQLPNVDLIVVTGPTASGKTRFAALLAEAVSGEIISADSRQVYRGMDLGTGKDLKDYEIGSTKIPYHLIDIIDPDTLYNVFAFQTDFLQAYQDIHNGGKKPVLCGGTGMYIESVLKGYRLIEVPPDPEFRQEAEYLSDQELVTQLESIHKLHNISDISTRKRLLRALEIARYYEKNPQTDSRFPDIRSKIIGIRFDRKVERERITQRLEQRLKEGMIQEVADLCKRYGYDRVEYFGLEYKFISWHLRGMIDYEQLFRQLNTAIHQFAKRQMTWFRRMEKNGLAIFWIPGSLPEQEKVAKALEFLSTN